MLYLFFIIFLLPFTESLNSPQKTKKLARENYKLVPYFANSYVRNYSIWLSRVYESLSKI